MSNDDLALPPTFGARLAEERRRLGLTQASLGDVVGVSKQTQRKYETDKTDPDARYLFAVHECGIDLIYVMFGQRLLNGPTLIANASDDLQNPIALSFAIVDERGDFELARKCALIKRVADLDPAGRRAFLLLLSNVLDQRDQT